MTIGEDGDENCFKNREQLCYFDYVTVIFYPLIKRTSRSIINVKKMINICFILSVYL